MADRGITLGTTVRFWANILGIVVKIQSGMFGDKTCALVRIGDDCAWVDVEDLTAEKSNAPKCHAISVTGRRCAADLDHPDDHFNYTPDSETWIDETWQAVSPLDSAIVNLDRVLDSLSHTVARLRVQRYTYSDGTDGYDVGDVIIDEDHRQIVGQTISQLHTVHDNLAAFENQEYI